MIVYCITYLHINDARSAYITLHKSKINFYGKKIYGILSFCRISFYFETSLKKGISWNFIRILLIKYFIDTMWKEKTPTMPTPCQGLELFVFGQQSRSKDQR